MFDYAAMGKKIRARRIALQYTQSRLAESAGISLSFMGHIERGTRKMGIDTLYRIALALNCSVDELMGTGKHSPRLLTARELLQLALERLE